MVEHQQTAQTGEIATLKALVNTGAERGMASGNITDEDGERVRDMAAVAARAAMDRVVDLLRTKTTRTREDLASTWEAPMRTAASAFLTTILVLPYLDRGEAYQLWAPWTVVQGRPPIHG